MRLTDCFAELVAYVAYFLKTVDSRQPPFDQVKADIQRLISESQHTANDGNFPQEDYDHLDHRDERVKLALDPCQRIICILNTVLSETAFSIVRDSSPIDIILVKCDWCWAFKSLAIWAI